LDAKKTCKTSSLILFGIEKPKSSQECEDAFYVGKAAEYKHVVENIEYRIALVVKSA
jgi:hypothetical protein